MKLKTYKQLWGMTGPLEEQFERIAQANYDGVETGVSFIKNSAKFKRLLKQHRLDFIPMLFTDGSDDWAAHLKSFERQLHAAIRFEPTLFNAHSLKDWMNFDDQCRYFEQALKLADKLGVTVLHETHRTRAMFSPQATAAVLQQFPEMRITADFSHFCVVCESMLDDQREALDLAISRTVHIHGRVGYEEGAQVPDPRAPEWLRCVEKHEQWWLRVVEAQRKAGHKVLTFTPEYGPPNYMPALPYTRQPIADLWDICLWQAERFRGMVK